MTSPVAGHTFYLPDKAHVSTTLNLQVIQTGADLLARLASPTRFISAARAPKKPTPPVVIQGADGKAKFH